MLLADTSAWIDYLKGTSSPVAQRLRQAIAGTEAVAPVETF